MQRPTRPLGTSNAAREVSRRSGNGRTIARRVIGSRGSREGLDPIDRPSRPLVGCSLPTPRGGRVRVASKRSVTHETLALVASQSSRHQLDSEAPADRSGPTGPAYPIGTRLPDRATAGGRGRRGRASIGKRKR